MPDALPFPSVTPRLSLPLLFAAQAQKELFHNEALARIDALLHPVVEDEADAPPSSPTDGESWLVGPAPTGAWSGHAGAVATFQAGAWLFLAPLPGMRVFVRAAQQSAIFVGRWQKAGAIQEPSGGLYVDSQARAAIGALISALRAAGIVSSV
jgi:hypothetical protein